jgi:hypothetical protein
MKRWSRVVAVAAVVSAAAWGVDGFARSRSGKPIREAAPALAPTPVTAPVAAPVAVAGGGGLHFEQALVVLPVAADAQTTVANFTFTNDTDQPVSIEKVEKACSCLAVEVLESKLHYAPGEGGVIRATFALENLSGEVEKSFHLYLKGDLTDRPTHTLTVRVLIPVLVKLSAKTLKWTLGEPPQAQKIDIEMAHTKPIRVVSTQASSEGFKLDLKVIEEGQHYELWVTPVATTEPGLAVIRLETDCEIARYKLQQVFAVIRNEAPGREGAVK